MPDGSYTCLLCPGTPSWAVPLPLTPGRASRAHYLRHHYVPPDGEVVSLPDRRAWDTLLADCRPLPTAEGEGPAHVQEKLA